MKISLISLYIAMVFLISTSDAFATDRLVPSQYPTIQAAIDAADDDDTIIVAPGTYYENTDFGEKSINLTSVNPNDSNIVAATIIDANGSGRAVNFPDTDSEDIECILSGLTITGGNSTSGGAIHCKSSKRTITITDCLITGNTSGEGGGINNYQNDLILINCTFSHNSSNGQGGAIASNGGRLELTDCTFKANEALFGTGGGIYIRNDELTLNDCTFSANSASDDGGGINSDYASVTITNCTFSENSSGQRGGGLNNSHASTNATNCIFSENLAEEGAGISTKHLYLGDLTINNCTFYGNLADLYGGAVSNWKQGNLTLTNCILWGNFADEGPQIAVQQTGSLSVTYCCIQGNEMDIYTDAAVTLEFGGNIGDDPCFADDANSDWHLKSTTGRWDANNNVWLIDGQNSPCIDTGDPNSDWTMELWPHGKRINIGAFGGTPQASMSTSTAGNIADLNHNGSVFWTDLKILTGKWPEIELLLAEDLNRDGIVNSKDYAIFANNWRWPE